MTPPTVTIRVSPIWFSPNGDGTRGSIRIVVDVDETATVTISITAAGRIVTSWTHEEVARSSAVRWDGRVGGVPQPDGIYEVEVTAADLAGNTSIARRRTVIDTVAPTFRWRGVTPDPSPGSGRHKIAFAARDRDARLKAKWTVHRRNGPRLGDVRTRSVSRSGVLAFTPRRPLAPGTYVVRMRLVDRAGNAGDPMTLPLRVHRPVTAKVIRNVRAAGDRVALTFDDCYDSDGWRRVLDVLRTHRIKGSFFCPGATLRSRRALAARTVREGHTVGGHAWDHAYLPQYSEPEIRRRLVADRDAWWRYGRATSAPYFRPPYGAYNAAVIIASGRTGHGHVIMWDVDPQDWRRPGSAAIARHVVGRARSGSVVVMHTLPQTAGALPAMIRGLRARGLQPASLDEMFAR